MKDPGPDISAFERERDYRAVLQGALEAWVAMDSGGFIIDWNAQAEATFGWSRDEAIGKVLAELIIPERYREPHWQGLQRYLATGEGPVIGQRIEIEALHKGGFEFPIELAISVRRSGAVTYFNAFLHDITDRVRGALYLDVLHAVTRILVDYDSEGRVITGLLQELGGRMGWQFGAYWRTDGETGRLVCVETWTDGAELLSRWAAANKGSSLEPGAGLAGRVWASQQTACVIEASDESDFRAQAAADAGLHAAICFPVGSDSRGRGVIEFLCTALVQADERLLDVLTSIGTQVGQHLNTLHERAEMLEQTEQLARTDELTGLPNRRAWQEVLERELARARRCGERFSVAMIDIDHFKAFNDAHGHQAGDDLLRETATRWSRTIRAIDCVARYGGEEFGLLLPACPPDSGPNAVERLRAAMPMGQTCSAGMAAWDGDESAAELVARADAALYDAKRSGRDRTVTADEIKLATPGRPDEHPTNLAAPGSDSDSADDTDRG